MKENKVNEIVFCKDDFDNNDNEMFRTIGEQLRILTKTQHICTFYADDAGLGIYVLQYEHDDKHPVTDTSYYGVINPYWLTPEQVEILESYEENK